MFSIPFISNCPTYYFITNQCNTFFKNLKSSFSKYLSEGCNNPVERLILFDSFSSASAKILSNIFFLKLEIPFYINKELNSSDRLAPIILETVLFSDNLNNKFFCFSMIAFCNS